ncbi:DNA polymerase III subunit gamma/tau [Neptuniibacter sp. QD48_55]|uniref:DNA polymerase III subunit gamma/tau n=1 Tax=Neptuniibacter sp. QD48_55 TaxID=3398212 RepID=UPI0039F5C14C
MSYQVLARKWRPAKFQEMVGQEHVLKALVNALDDDRLHHAYLFTGTRGVGKTSIARLFAKSLNCEQGVSSTPCGQCSACKEIAEGRFVDLIEVDAASRTKVEDTRELMENVQYAPTHGRYKVYLIDEVHMLSTHSFNALLKTLEEPPPHVKFLLATTDPQKLPITILSRCLQFNLKNLIPERIVNHLRTVLTAEQIQFEEPALWLLARSADGSMRDAMSLTDQAIAFGAGQIGEADVRAMLGTIDQRLVYQMLFCLAASDAKGLMAAVTDLAQFSPDYNTVLGDLIGVLHRIAMAQTIPEAVDNSMGDKDQIIELAGKLTAEDVQLYYQVALMGRKDLPFVPDPREGLEMVLLRMLAFRPASAQPRQVEVASSSPQQVSQTTTASVTTEVPPPVAESIQPAPVAHTPVVQTAPAPQSAPMQPAPAHTDSQPPAVESPPPYEQPLSDVPPLGQASPMAPVAEVSPAKKPEAVNNQGDEPPPWDMDDVGGFDDSEPSNRAAENSYTEMEAVAPVSEPVLQAEVTEEIGEISKTRVEVVECSRNLAEVSLPDWVHISRSLGLSGMTESLATHLSLEQISSESMVLHYTKEQKTMLNEVQCQRISDALNGYFNNPVQVEFLQAEQQQETPAQFINRKREERHLLAVESIRNDSTVQLLQEHFDARIELSSVVPIDN